MRKYILLQISTIVALLFSVQAIVAQCPQPTATFGTIPSTVCTTTPHVWVSYQITGFADQYKVDWDGTPGTWLTLWSPSGVLQLSLPSSAGSHSGNIYVRHSSTGCQSIAYPVTININATPVVTLAANPKICQGSSASISYTVTAGLPDQFLITWDAAAIAAGLTNVPATALTNPITISNSFSQAGVFSGVLSVRNSSTGCISGKPFSVFVGSTITLGTPSSVCAGTPTTIPYSSTTQSPNQYRIDWDANANAAGLPDVGPTTLPANQITTNTPVTVGTFSATVYVLNSTTGCESVGYSKSVTTFGPSITIVNPNIGLCATNPTAIFNYAGPLGSPTKYRIEWSQVATDAGFQTVPLTTLPSSPPSAIHVSVPACPPGVYSGILFVQNALGCESGNLINITVSDKPGILPLSGLTGTACIPSPLSFVNYSSTINSPDKYRIIWDSYALGHGVQNVGLTDLPAGAPIPVQVVPIPGTWNGTLYVNKSGCQSDGIPISISSIITDISIGANPTVCTGTSTSSLPYTTANGDQYKIDWSTPANAAGLVDDASFVTLPAASIPINNIPATPGVYTGSLYVRNTTTGCTSLAYSINVTVTPRPVVTVTTPTTICSGSSTNLTAGGAVNYTWSPMTGLTLSTTTTVIASPAVTTTYTVTGTDTNGCWSTAATTVTVNPTPGVPAVITPVTYCQSSTATSLTATGSSMTWYTVPTGGTGTMTAPTPSTSIIGTTSYYVSQTLNGCESTRAKIDVVVNSRPNASITSTPPDFTICSGSMLTVDGNINATGSWTLALNDGTTISGIGSGTWSKSMSITGPITYTIASLVDGVCSANASDLTGSKTVSIYERPVAAITTNDAIVCGTATTPVGGMITARNNWTITLSDGTVVTGMGGSWSTNVHPSATTTYTIVSVVDEVCSSIASDMSGSKTVTVTSRPTATITTPNVTYCNGTSGNPAIVGTVVATGNWTLTLSNGATATGTGNSPWTINVSPSVTTNYTVASLVDQACASQAGDLTGSSLITINPTTAISTQPSGAPQTVCQGGSTTALSVVASGTGPLAYQWYSNTVNSNSGGTLIIGATSSSYTPPSTSAGTIYYYVIATGGCGVVTSSVSGAITINPATVISTQPSATPQAVCQGGSTTALSVVASGTGPLSYQWYSNTTNSNTGGTSIATSANYAPSSATVGTKYYYVIVSGGCGAVASSVSSVVVNARPIPTITALSCFGSATQSTYSTQYGMTDYVWNVTGSTTSISGTGTNTLIVKWSTAAAGKTVNVNYKNAAGCQASIPTTINVTPTTAPTIVPGTNPYVCLGNTTATMSYSSPTGSPSQYRTEWDATNPGVIPNKPLANFGASPSNINITSIPAIAGLYTGNLFVKANASACESKYSINVNVAATINLGASPSLAVCAGTTTSSIPYSGTTGTPNNYKIVWLNGTTVNWTSLPANVIPITGIPSAAGTYTANVYVKSTVRNCESPAYPVSVTVNTLPAASITIPPGSSTTFCSGQTINVLLNANPTGANFIYGWRFNDRPIRFGPDDAGEAPASYTATEVGTYVAFVENSITGCYKTATVSVSVQTNGTMMANGDLCADGLVTLSTKPGTGHIWYYMILPSGTWQRHTYYDNSPTYPVYNPGTYKVEYVSASGCSVFDEMEIVTNGSPCNYARVHKPETPVLEKEVEESTLGVYPNPANDVITVELDEPALTNLEVNLISQMGSNVGSSKISKGEKNATLNSKNITDGVYIVTVKSVHGFVMRQKMMVKH